MSSRIIAGDNHADADADASCGRRVGPGNLTSYGEAPDVTLFGRYFLAPGPIMVAALVSVSDDKIQITILMLRRGADASCCGEDYLTMRTP